MSAARNNDVDVVSLLIAAGADGNIKDMWDLTPLMFASERGFLHVVKLLVSMEGILLDAKHEGSWTALHWAAFKNCIEVAKELLAAGADMNVINNEDKTPQQVAHDKGHSTIIETFEQHLATMQRNNTINSQQCLKEDV